MDKLFGGNSIGSRKICNIILTTNTVTLCFDKGSKQIMEIGMEQSKKK